MEAYILFQEALYSMRRLSLGQHCQRYAADDFGMGMRTLHNA